MPTTPPTRPALVPIVAIAAGVACFAGAVVLTLASHAVPAELWVAGTSSLAGGLGLAAPSSPAVALTPPAPAPAPADPPAPVASGLVADPAATSGTSLPMSGSSAAVASVTAAT